MTILKILEFPDPKLRIKAVPVETIDDALQIIIDNMLETMYAAPGIGLAATQVDIHRRFLVADITAEKNKPYVLINPKIIKKNGDDDRHQSFLELGFTHDNEISQARIYSYNLKTYNNKRGWNNPEGWANPENFEKFRW